jgi:hypothetical protein
MQLREIISQMIEVRWTREHFRMLARECKEKGRLVRIGEVSGALDVSHGSLSRRFAHMGVTMPREYTKRDEWEGPLMEHNKRCPRAGTLMEKAAPLWAWGKDIPRKAAAHQPNSWMKRGDGYKGDASRAVTHGDA